jgi:hypothetical protein
MIDSRMAFGLMAISDQARNNVDETADRATMTSLLTLGNVLDLIQNVFNNGPSAQESFVA